MYAIVLLVIGSYLLGSVPTSYVAGRLLKDIDIRDYGSGIASGSNVWHSVSKWAVVPVGIFDMMKGFVPVIIAMQLNLTLGGSEAALQGLTALAAIIGHSWSVFLKFDGGRGVTPMMGALGAIAPWSLIIFIAVWVIGLWLFKNSPLMMMAGVIVMIVTGPFIPTNIPLAADDPLMTTWFLIGMAMVLILKRLIAERPIPRDKRSQVMLCRLLYDRDTRNRLDWIYRHPTAEERSAGE